MTGSPRTVPHVDPRRLLAEQIAHLRRQMPLVLGANLVVVPFVALALQASLTPSGSLLWCVALEMLTVLRWWLLRQSTATRGDSASSARHDQTLFFLGSLGSGILWGLMGGAVTSASLGMDPVLALMFICGMVSGAIGSLSTFPRVYAAFAVPAVLPVITVYLLRLDIGALTYAFAATIFLAVNIGYALSFSRTLAASIALRFENADLIAQLEEARSRAEAESVLKTRFLQSASHDLRQPLHAVALTLTDLSERVPVPLKPKLDRGLASLQSLAELLDRLLEASRFGAGSIPVTSGAVDLAALFASLEFEAGPEAAASGLSVTFRPTSLTVESDGLIVTQILRNHLSNALRHARTRVLVAVRKRHGKARIEIWDDGPGIPADQQEAIYEAFYQIGNAERDSSRGHGLGLAIVAGMTRVIGATGGLCSRPGHGSVFFLTLPLSDMPGSIRESALDRRTPPAHASSPETKNRVILVIEDDPTLLAATAELLTGWGAATETAHDAESALALLRRGVRPDAVISDLHLPGPLNGVEAIGMLHRELGRSIPALIVTGAAEPIPEAERPGMAMMKKPVLPGRLKAWIQALPE